MKIAQSLKFLKDSTFLYNKMFLIRGNLTFLQRQKNLGTLAIDKVKKCQFSPS